MKEFIRMLGIYRGALKKQQIKTLRGQALAGDVEGAKRGLQRIVARNMKELK